MDGSNEAWIWTAGGLIFAVVSTLGVYTFRLADRLSKSDAKADAANVAAETADKRAAAATARTISLEKQLTDHRVSVAKDYVSNEMLARLEKGIMDAINRLGDRLDKVLTQPHQ